MFRKLVAALTVVLLLLLPLTAMAYTKTWIDYIAEGRTEGWATLCVVGGLAIICLIIYIVAKANKNIVAKANNKNMNTARELSQSGVHKLMLNTFNVGDWRIGDGGGTYFQENVSDSVGGWGMLAIRNTICNNSSRLKPASRLPVPICRFKTPMKKASRCCFHRSFGLDPREAFLREGCVKPIVKKQVSCYNRYTGRSG